MTQALQRKVLDKNALNLIGMNFPDTSDTVVVGNTRKY